MMIAMLENRSRESIAVPKMPLVAVGWCRLAEPTLVETKDPQRKIRCQLRLSEQDQPLHISAQSKLDSYQGRGVKLAVA